MQSYYDTFHSEGVLEVILLPLVFLIDTRILTEPGMHSRATVKKTNNGSVVSPGHLGQMPASGTDRCVAAVPK